MHTTVGTVMATDVIAIPEDTRFRDIVDILRGNGVDAVPVLNSAGQVTGVVSTTDLLLKEADPTAAENQSPISGPRRRRERRKAGGATAAELMSTPARTVTPDTAVETAARQMRRHRISRLVVVAPGTARLLGIVTRSDLLGVYHRPDDDIRREIHSEIVARRPGLRSALIKVTVDRGEVILDGRVTRRSQIPGLLHDVRRVEGVVSARSRMDWDTDDTMAYRPYL